MKNKLQELLENVAPVKSKKNNLIDYRTLIGRTTNDFTKRLLNTSITVDPIQKIIKDAADQKPAVELPDEAKEESETVISERTVRRVIGGEVVKDKDEKTKRREANQNSSLSAAERSRNSKKAARTRSKDKAGVRDAVDKREKAKKKRDLLGLN